MSHVILIAADKELPLLDHERETSYENHRFTFANGVRVLEHEYYRWAVDELGFEMKPCQYELDVVQHENDLRSLVDYLKENFTSGEEAELWSLWVGSGGGERPRRYRGRLSEFDLDTLGMLTELQKEPDLTNEYPDGLLSQICLTIEI